MKASVMVVHPRAEAGVTVRVDDLRIGGGFLQQIAGPQVGTLNQAQQGKVVVEESGEVVTLTDNDGCVKMCIEGPDTVLVSEGISEEVKDWMKEKPLAIQNNTRLPKRPKVVSRTAIAVKNDGIVHAKKKSRKNSRKKMKEKKMKLKEKAPKDLHKHQRNGDVAVVYVYRSDESGFKNVDNGEGIPLFTIPIGDPVSTGNLRFVDVKDVKEWFVASMVY